MISGRLSVSSISLSLSSDIILKEPIWVDSSLTKYLVSSFIVASSQRSSSPLSNKIIPPWEKSSPRILPLSGSYIIGSWFSVTILSETKLADSNNFCPAGLWPKLTPTRDVVLKAESIRNAVPVKLVTIELEPNVLDVCVFNTLAYGFCVF